MNESVEKCKADFVGKHRLCLFKISYFPTIQA